MAHRVDCPLPSQEDTYAASVAGTCLERYLPLAVLTTAAVTVLPVTLVAWIVRSERPLLMLASVALAMALSVTLTSAGAWLWKRWPGSRDLVFADLMLWGWARRYWTERRLGRTHLLYEAARRAGPWVSIDLILRLNTLLEARDASTQGHSQRVARHAGRIAHAMYLSSEAAAKVRTAAAVHDVGKLYTPRAVLNNPGCLSDEEYRVLKRHPVDGADMLAGVGDPEITAMVRHHHERIDGSGYPDGLAGREIPLGARIIAVADTFDAISSDRVYRSARSHKKALDILSREAGSQLDGAVVAAFVTSYTARRPVARLAFASAAAQRILGVAASFFVGPRTRRGPHYPVGARGRRRRSPCVVAHLTPSDAHPSCERKAPAIHGHHQSRASRAAATQRDRGVVNGSTLRKTPARTREMQTRANEGEPSDLSRARPSRDAARTDACTRPTGAPNANPRRQPARILATRERSFVERGVAQPRAPLHHGHSHRPERHHPARGSVCQHSRRRRVRHYAHHRPSRCDSPLTR